MRTWLLLGLVVWYGGLQVGGVRVWRTESTLWAHAYSVSPTAPRSAVNHARFVSDREARRMLSRLRPGR